MHHMELCVAFTSNFVVVLLQRVEDVLFFDKRDNSEFGESVIHVSFYNWHRISVWGVCVQVYVPPISFRPPDSQ